MEFIIETPLSPHMAGRSTGLIARDSLLPYMASRASRFKAGRQSPSLVPSSNHDTICAMSVQCVHPISVASRILWTNAEPSSKHGEICAMSVQCVHPISVAPRISRTYAEPSSKHGTIGAKSFQSKSSVCFSSPSSKHDPICAVSVQCVRPISVVPRISWTNAEPSSKHGTICAMSFQSESSLCFS